MPPFHTFEITGKLNKVSSFGVDISFGKSEQIIMKKGDSLFSIWGSSPNGTRSQAPGINRSWWKKEGRIPAGEQPYVLAIAEQIGIPITAEHVVFPLVALRLM
jgi:hypothetical protein